MEGVGGKKRPTEKGNAIEAGGRFYRDRKHTLKQKQERRTPWIQPLCFILFSFSTPPPPTSFTASFDERKSMVLVGISSVPAHSAGRNTVIGCSSRWAKRTSCMSRPSDPFHTSQSLLFCFSLFALVFSGLPGCFSWSLVGGAGVIGRERLSEQSE